MNQGQNGKEDIFDGNYNDSSNVSMQGETRTQRERGDACGDVLSPPMRWGAPVLVAASTTLVCAAVWLGELLTRLPM